MVLHCSEDHFDIQNELQVLEIKILHFILDGSKCVALKIFQNPGVPIEFSFLHCLLIGRLGSFSTITAGEFFSAGLGINLDFK